MKKYYSMETQDDTTDIYIYGEITSWAGEWANEEYGDMSAHLLSNKIKDIASGVINVYINSPGGEVSEGLAIYTALKRHSARVHTYCDGFACSAASVIFMAGDERIMSDASLLMIHNASTYASGDAKKLHKTAQDLEIISAAAANAYRDAVNIEDTKLQDLLDAETWIPPQDALNMGFATKIESYAPNDGVTASAQGAIMARMLHKPQDPPHVDIDALAQHLFDKLKANFAEQGKPQDNTFLGALMRGKE